MLREPDLRPSRSREELLTLVYARGDRLRLLRRLRIAIPVALAMALVAGTLPLLLHQVSDDARRIAPAEKGPRETAPAERARPRSSRGKTSQSLSGVGPGPRRAADTATSAQAGGVIAYMDTPDPDGPIDIYVRRLGSDRARNLTPGPGWEGDPAWSPDATKIAFTSAERPDHDHFQIYVMDADGSHQSRLTHTDCSAEPTCQDALPTWSPDGSQIAFERRLASPAPDATRTTGTGKEYNGQIWVMDADGSNAHLVAPGYAPEWSPDGKHIAFFSGVGSTNPCAPAGFRECEGQLYMMDPDGSNIRALGVNGFFWTSWWPDGSRLTFAHQTSSSERFRIWTIRPDGSGLTALTTSEQGFSVQPAVSPDARRIVFVRCTASCSLWVMNSDGTGQQELPGAFGVEQYRPEFAPRRS